MAMFNPRSNHPVSLGLYFSDFHHELLSMDLNRFDDELSISTVR